MPLLIPAITDTLPRLLISLGIFHTSAVCLVVFVVCGSELNGFIYFLSLRICICIISFKKKTDIYWSYGRNMSLFAGRILISVIVLWVGLMDPVCDSSCPLSSLHHKKKSLASFNARGTNYNNGESAGRLLDFSLCAAVHQKDATLWSIKLDYRGALCARWCFRC